MAAVLRVKRRNDDEPLHALVISCKRRKTDDNAETKQPELAPVTAVVKFAGTVQNQEDDVVEHLVKALGKDELKANFKQHPVDTIGKNREKTKQASAENRYKVVNCVRALDTSNVEELKENVMTVIDVEDSVSCSVPKDPDGEQNDDYVYDLYYTHNQGDIYLDGAVSIHVLDQEFVFDTYRNNTVPSDTECESEDSNSESNWKNDYPDSDHSEGSIDEEDMRNAVGNMKLDSGDSPYLSSDEDFVYAVNEDDVERYGYKYAKYKARVIEELDKSDVDSDRSSAYTTGFSEDCNESGGE